MGADEATELAALLIEEHPHITEALLRQVYKNRKAHFIQFIRHILGIEVLQSFPDTVSAVFDQFIRAHTTIHALVDLKAKQLQAKMGKPVKKRGNVDSHYPVLQVYCMKRRFLHGDAPTCAAASLWSPSGLSVRLMTI